METVKILQVYLLVCLAGLWVVHRSNNSCKENYAQKTIVYFCHMQYEIEWVHNNHVYVIEWSVLSITLY